MLGLYLTGALASGAALVAFAPELPIVTVGGSGAIAALVGGCAVACRRSRLTSLELPFAAVAARGSRRRAGCGSPTPAQPVAGTGGDIAYLAPAGGLRAGALLGLQSSRAKAASNATPDGAKSVRRTNARASRAPYSRSIPESSHSIESGPS